MLIVLGLAAAITVTILYGAWWTFFVVGGLAVAVFGWSDVLDRREARERSLEEDPPRTRE